MPVIELSNIITVLIPLLYTISIKPVIPEWINVESPITETNFLANSLPRAFAIPKAADTDAPIQIVESTLSNGFVAPRV